MKYPFILILFVSILSCNNSDKGKEEQGRIDSLANESIKMNKEDEEKQEKADAIIKERNAVLTKVVISPVSSEPALPGGFKHVRFAIFNRYNYKVEQIILKVHFMNTDSEEAHSETIVQDGMAPISLIGLTAPEYTVSGKYLKYTVETVVCKAINLCYHKNADIGVSNDPYQCK